MCRNMDDKNQFLHVQNVFPEISFEGLLERIENHHYYSYDDGRMISSFLDYVESKNDFFFSKEIAASFSGFVGALKELNCFISTQFFVWPNVESGRYCLKPEFNFDRGGTGRPEEFEEYDRLVGQLNGYVDNSRDAYRKFRKAVKANVSL